MISQSTLSLLGSALLLSSSLTSAAMAEPQQHNLKSEFTDTTHTKQNRVKRCRNADMGERCRRANGTIVVRVDNAQGFVEEREYVDYQRAFGGQDLGGRTETTPRRAFGGQDLGGDSMEAKETDEIVTNTQATITVQQGPGMVRATDDTHVGKMESEFTDEMDSEFTNEAQNPNKIN